MYNICWSYDIYMALYDRLEISSMDHESLVYKVDNPVKSFLSSSLILILIQGSFS